MATQAELRARLEDINRREKERRAALAARKAKLLAQLKAASRPSKSQRRQDARRKILLGAFVLDQLDSQQLDPRGLEFLGKRFSDWLVRETDRAVFGLATAPADPAPLPGSLPAADTPLNVPFADKDRAKALGARWQADLKRWVAPAGADLTPFAPWLS